MSDLHISFWVLPELIAAVLAWAMWFISLSLRPTNTPAGSALRSYRLVIFAVSLLLGSLFVGHSGLWPAQRTFWVTGLVAVALTPLGLRLVRRANGRPVTWREGLYWALSGLSLLALLAAPGASVPGGRLNPLGFPQAVIDLPAALMVGLQALAVVWSARQRLGSDAYGPMRGNRELVLAWLLFSLSAALEVLAMLRQYSLPPLFWVGATALTLVFARMVHAHQTATALALTRSNAELLALSGDLETRVETRTRDLLHQAMHDELTGLPNRKHGEQHLNAALARAHQSGRAVGLLFIDLDRFKNLNDTLGHPAGDALLIEVAARFQVAAQQSGPDPRGPAAQPPLVARFGGDEFMVVLPDLEPAAAAGQAEQVSQALGRSLQAAIRIGEAEFYVDASIGISVAPQDGADAIGLERHADLAMYRAKRERLGQVAFTPDLEAGNQERVSLERALRFDLEHPASSAFELVYQPVIDLGNGQVCALEALVRWSHGPPEARVLLRPTQFLPVAEESGLMAKLDRWVLTEACRQAAEWQAEGLAPVRINVNISTKLFERPDFPGQVEAVLGASGLDARWLGLELLESVLVTRFEETAGHIQQLRDLGVWLALDDFGSGYSSLSYLHRLSFDALKIDRAFVGALSRGSDHDLDPEPASERDSRPLLAAIFSIAEEFALEVVVEGIEHEAQLGVLRQMGARYGQGYLFHHPLPPVSVAALLADQHGRGQERPSRAPGPAGPWRRRN